MQPSTQLQRRQLGSMSFRSLSEAMANLSAPRRKMGQIESNAMTQENNTNEFIRDIAHSGALEGQDIGKTWDKLCDHWSENPKQAQEHPGTPDPDIPPARD